MRLRLLIVPVLLAVGAAALVGGCREQKTGQVAALEDPQALATISGCFDVADGSRFFSADSDECEIAGRVYAAVVADPTNQWLQVAALDTLSFRTLSANRRGAACLTGELTGVPCVDRKLRGARFVDFDSRLPGNSGLALPTSPTRVVASNLEGVVWVIGQNPRVLMAVDVIHARFATFEDGGDVFALEHPVSDLLYLEDEGELILADPAGKVLRRLAASVSCENGENGENVAGCALTASVSTSDAPPVALGYAPRFIDADQNGDVFVSADDARWVIRVSLGDGDCPPESPCRIPLTWECNDGIDNDGDGLIDGDDESCFQRTDSESPITYNGTAPECGDGIDNDGDGLVDAHDPSCRGRGGSEASDGDDAPLPRYKRSPVYAGPLALTPDGDILVVGERGGNRSRFGAANEVLLACVNPPENEADEGQPHLCQAKNTLITTALNGDRTREHYLGATVTGTITSILTFDRVEELRVTNDDNTGSVPLLEKSRFAWAATSNGIISSLLIDETFYWSADESGEEYTTGYVGVARLQDADRNNPEVRSLKSELPDRFPTYPGDDPGIEPPEPGDDEFFPSLIALAPYLVGARADATDVRLDSITNTESAAFVAIEPEERYCFVGRGLEELGCLPRPPRNSGFEPYRFKRQLSDLPDGDAVPYSEDLRIVPNGFKIPDDEWYIEWEGSLLIGFSGARRDIERRDAIVLDDFAADDGSTWVRFLGRQPCRYATSEQLCAMEFGWNSCDVLDNLCADGVDLCTNDVTICDLCPEACPSEVNLCEADVREGDIFVMPPLSKGSYCRAGDADCSSSDIPPECLDSAGGDAPYYGTATNERVSYGNQFRIVEVADDGVRIQPLEFSENPRWPSPNDVPSERCVRRPFRAQIVAADSWLLGGRRLYGHDSPYEEIHGECQLRADGLNHTSRPDADRVWLDPSGLRFKIDSGEFLRFCDGTPNPVECRHTMRGYRFTFTTEDRFRTLTVSGVGTLSIAAAYSANRNLRFPLLLFLDMGSGSLFFIENQVSPASDTIR